MSNKIKETPILRGADARRFLKNAKNSSSNKVSSEERAKILSSYEKMKSISKFI